MKRHLAQSVTHLPETELLELRDLLEEETGKTLDLTMEDLRRLADELLHAFRIVFVERSNSDDP